ncbi:helix-turn-helix domain-containing protein [Trujillonella humicola]|uniref:helix-turn-helix domain-containing protein n=1 Tax=Trujillonella humicola TaxID=3383699 RepID=UPI003906BD96
MALTAERWSTAALPEPDRVDALREIVSATHLPWALTPAGDDGGPPVGAELTRYRLGDVSLVDCRCGPCAGRRGRPQLAATDDDVVGVLFVRSGREEVELAGRRLVVPAGSALVWHADEAVRFRVPGPLHKQTLLVPRTRLPLPGDRRLLGPAAAGLVTGVLSAAVAGAGRLDGRLGATVADAAIDLLAAALAGDDGPADDATWRRVTAHVDAHLGDPGLTPEALAAAVWVSVRSLYGVFAARGLTPAGYVRRRRLEAARRELQRRGTAVTVAEVAHRWGFREQATFSRGFRAAFGSTPDQVRRGGAQTRTGTAR